MVFGLNGAIKCFLVLVFSKKENEIEKKLQNIEVTQKKNWMGLKKEQKFKFLFRGKGNFLLNTTVNSKGRGGRTKVVINKNWDVIYTLKKNRKIK